jgi:hypothetical protein
VLLLQAKTDPPYSKRPPIEAAFAPVHLKVPPFSDSGRPYSGEVTSPRCPSAYAFVIGWPEKLVLIKLLATSSPLSPPKIQSVELLGYKGKITWIQDERGLTVVMPQQKPCEYAITLKIT